MGEVDIRWEREELLLPRRGKIEHAHLGKIHFISAGIARGGVRIRTIAV